MKALLDLLRTGRIQEFNEWRRQHGSIPICFRRCHLDGWNLSGADFSGADLEMANLIRANMTRCNFQNANLFHVSWSFADVTEADFRGANLVGIRHYLSVKGLASARFEGAKVSRTAKECLLEAVAKSLIVVSKS